MHRLMLTLSLLLGGCMSYTYDISDRPTYSHVGIGPARTVVALNLYRVTSKGGSTFRTYVLSTDIVRNSRDPLDFVRIVPQGTEVYIQRISREKGSDGFLWDFVLGSIFLDGAVYEFETNLGLSDSPRPIPYLSSNRDEK